jgi:predicted dehydrogenase
MRPLRIGIVGLGQNARQRHIPGFRTCEDVQLAAVCNRRPESTRRAAADYAIPRKYDRWADLVRDPDLDAVMVGTWPYLHCAVTVAALEQGKHVLTEARMAANLAEARAMYDAAQQHPELVTQIVPSPLGLRAGQLVQRLIETGYIGELREFVVAGTNADFADPTAPLHWRQSAELSGRNVLTLGIMHETLTRWIPDPVHVFASHGIYTQRRPDPNTGCLVPVSRPDSVHVLTGLPNGARGIYHLSAVVQHGAGFQICLYGSQGTLQYQLSPHDSLWGARQGETLQEIEVPEAQRGQWRVEADFVEAIRGGKRPQLTDFETGLKYMEFTEAVELSARTARAVNLPLDAR